MNLLPRIDWKSSVGHQRLNGAHKAVQAAGNGFEALVALRESSPDIIISDLKMPNMSGFEFLSAVRKRFAQIATIAI